MSLKNVHDWLFTHRDFTERLTRITASSVLSDLPNILRAPIEALNTDDINYLLTCGSVLAAGENPAAQAAALRIATGVMLETGAAGEQRDAAAFLCERLRNRPTIRLAESRQYLSPAYAERLPIALQLDVVKNSVDSAIFLGDGDVIRVNGFQALAWDAIENYGCVSISAPTSSGKSFLVKRWLELTLATGNAQNVVFIVPTRALIHEVETDLRNHFLARGLLTVNVSSMPTADVLETPGTHVLVYTQERLHLFAHRIVPGFRPDILIVDEAQKVGDASRGVLLQQMIDMASSNSRLRSLIYAAPHVENPELLLSDAPANFTTTSIRSEQLTVCQNLIWATQQRRKPTKWDIRLVDGDAEQRIGELQLRFDPSPESKRLTFVADALGRAGGGNLVYVNGAADAEKAANQLYDLAPRESGTAPQEIVDLIELTRRTVHANYGLSRVLQRGIAFHYGNMPLVLRLGIEQLFKLDKLRFLVCTSTLLEGVNLPCRNIFVRGPQKGRGHAMTPADFWNLAGRAGRWGKEFQGNIVCVDADQANVWKTYGAPRRRVRSRILRTVDQVAADPDAIIAYIQAGTPRDIAAQRPALEQYVSYAWGYWRLKRTLDGFPAARTLTASARADLAAQIELVDAKLILPDEVIIRNQGISPIAMQSLLDYFGGRGRPLDEYLPAAASSNDAVESYVRIIERIDRHLALNVFGVTNGRRFQLALLVVGWMRGYSLARLIASWITSLKKRNKPVRLASEIRSVMSDVENVARFIAPKYIGCYVDVLRTFLTVNRHDELAVQLNDVSLQLELGASTQTQISLIGLGLTRTTAVEVAGLIANSDFNKTECLSWLAEQEWNSIDLPNLMKHEILLLLDNASPPRNQNRAPEDPTQ